MNFFIYYVNNNHHTFGSDNYLTYNFTSTTYRNCVLMVNYELGVIWDLFYQVNYWNKIPLCNLRDITMIRFQAHSTQSSSISSSSISVKRGPETQRKPTARYLSAGSNELRKKHFA